MSKTLKILAPTLPDGVTHTSTSWYINSKHDFTGTEYLKSENDAVHLVEIEIPFDLVNSTVYYAKVIMKFSNGYEEASDVLTFNNRESTNDSEYIFFPPKVRLESYGIDRKAIKASIDNVRFYYGDDEHMATSWRVRDTSGNTIWSRADDDENKFTILIPEEAYMNYDAVVVEAKYEFKHIDSNTWGRRTFILRYKEAEVRADHTVLTANKTNYIYLNYVHVAKLVMRYALYAKDTVIRDWDTLSNPIEIKPEDIEDYETITLKVSYDSLRVSTTKDIELTVNKDWEPKTKALYPSATVSTVDVSTPSKLTLMDYSAHKYFIYMPPETTFSVYKISNTPILIKNLIYQTGTQSDRFLGNYYVNNHTLLMVTKHSTNNQFTLFDVADEYLTPVKTFDTDLKNDNIYIVSDKVFYITKDNKIGVLDINTSDVIKQDIPTNTLTTVDAIGVIGSNRYLLSTDGNIFNVANNSKVQFSNTAVTDIRVYPMKDNILIVYGDNAYTKLKVFNGTTLQEIYADTISINKHNVLLDHNTDRIIVLKG